MTATKPETWKQYLSEKHRDALLHLRCMFLRYLLDKQVDGQGSVDEIRDMVPVGVNPKILGMVTRGLPVEGLGWKTNQNKATHGRPIRVWRLRSREAAQQWLADHERKESGHADTGTSKGPEHQDRGSDSDAGQAERQGRPASVHPSRPQHPHNETEV